MCFRPLASPSQLLLSMSEPSVIKIAKTELNQLRWRKTRSQARSIDLLLPSMLEPSTARKISKMGLNPLRWRERVARPARGKSTFPLVSVLDMVARSNLPTLRLTYARAVACSSALDPKF